MKIKSNETSAPQTYYERSERINNESRSEGYNDKLRVERVEQNKARIKSEQELAAGMKSTLDKAVKLSDDFDNNLSNAKTVAKELYDKMYENQLIIKFDVDANFDQLIVKMVHRGTGEVAWQLPPAYSLAVRKIAQYMPGIFLNEKA